MQLCVHGQSNHIIDCKEENTLGSIKGHTAALEKIPPLNDDDDLTVG